MSRPNPDEDQRPTEDDLAKKELGGQRGMPNAEPPKMTPRQRKNTPESGEFDGHTA